MKIIDQVKTENESLNLYRKDNQINSNLNCLTLSYLGRNGLHIINYGLDQLEQAKEKFNEYKHIIDNNIQNEIKVIV
jgi:hypothetical protein